MIVPDLRNDTHSFEFIVHLASYTKSRPFEELILDFRYCNWIDANMCSPLGAVLYRHTLGGISINFINLKPSVEVVLRRNGFLTTFTAEIRTRDKWGTVIPYRRYNQSEERSFPDYILRLSKSRGELKFNDKTRNALFNVTLEIFNNSVYHSGSRSGIFVCGHYYPNKKILRFGISDLGHGFSASIRARYLRDLPELKAIAWSLREGNSTRVDYPGGLGLYLLNDFVRRNGGNLSIVSKDAYLDVITGTKNNLPLSFPGVSVIMEIRTDRETDIIDPDKTKFNSKVLF